ncbi:MAG: HAD-IIIC family phosphatase [Clostridia bacterium]|nr:HAD-IIIC family phosphatase [Clostridia bacterium]
MDKIKLTVVSNVTLEPLFPQSTLTATFIPYDGYRDGSFTAALREADVVAVLLNFDAFYPEFITDCLRERDGGRAATEDYTDKSKLLYEFLKQTTPAPILWLGAEDLCYYAYTYTVGNRSLTDGVADSINAYLSRMLVAEDVYIDWPRMIAGLGTAHAFDLRGKHRWNAPYSRALLAELSAEVVKQYQIAHSLTKKCLVLDCDNVLWDGVLTEDGVENIRITPAHRDLQRYVLSLYHRGVILAVCSKNDREDVLFAFRQRSDMLLREEHIACFSVSWEDKPSGIRAIAELLNIGLDSIVFLDDSSFEVEAVRAVLPEVTAIRYERETVYEAFSCFCLPLTTDAERIKHRTETYQTNGVRATLRAESTSYEAYLAALAMRVEIRAATPVELSRLSELSRRTNKCTNGRRYTAEQLKAKCANGYCLYTVTLSDRFSDLGIVGVIGVEGSKLDLFALSCRALGRGLEMQMLTFACANGAETAAFISTEKNKELQEQLRTYLSPQ